MNCEICAGVVYRCGICNSQIHTHSHENDYSCDKCNTFVNPIRESDNARIDGSGTAGPPSVIGYIRSDRDTRLIAAAPELLAVIREALPPVEDFLQGMPELADKMRELIARIDGERP